MRYVLTAHAEDQLTTLLYELAVHAGWSRSMDVEEKLYDAFRGLAKNPGIGHTRSDLTHLPIHFYYAEPYLVIYQRETTPLRIVAIHHGSRNLAEILLGEID